MPRYVILEHDHPFLHWDLMLEDGVRLLTWRLVSPPARHEVLHAERLGDHRRHYLDYEGPVSGGRGCVTRWDMGTFEWLVNVANRVEVRLHGQRIEGTLSLNCATDAVWLGSLS